MFIDRAIIEVRSGKGGNGRIAFRRERGVPKGGPAGGNGGRGGSVYLRCSKSTTTLVNYRHSRTFIAEDGENVIAIQEHLLLKMEKMAISRINMGTQPKTFILIYLLARLSF